MRRFLGATHLTFLPATSSTIAPIAASLSPLIQSNILPAHLLTAIPIAASCPSIQSTFLPPSSSTAVSVAVPSPPIHTTSLSTSSSTVDSEISKNVKSRRHRSAFRAGNPRSLKIDQLTEATRSELARCFAEVRRENISETKVFAAVLAKYTLKWHDPDLDYLHLPNIRDYWRNTVDQRKRKAATPDLTKLHKVLRQTKTISSSTPLKVQPNLQLIRPKPTTVSSSSILTPLAAGEKSSFSTIAFPSSVVSTFNSSSTSSASSEPQPSATARTDMQLQQPSNSSLSTVTGVSGRDLGILPILSQPALLQQPFLQHHSYIKLS